MLDCVHLGSSLSLRNFARLGSSLSTAGLLCFGSSLAVLDVDLGSALSLRSFARLGSSLAVACATRSAVCYRFCNPGSCLVIGDQCVEIDLD